MSITNKKIKNLVGENYVYASVLYYFGIKFYDYSEKTLKQVCDEKGLDIEHVITSLESVSKGDEAANLQLSPLPIDLIIEYLKHAHYTFIKQRLPYIARLVENINLNGSSDQLSKDLKLIIPLFIEDFIHHMYEEEDTLFSYIQALHKAKQGKYNPSDLYYKMERLSIQKFSMEHEAHDDEMKGIRELTENYSLKKGQDLQMKVLLCELSAFEKDLITHAVIENEVMFPKALVLEKEVKSMLKERIRFN
ncbi:hemerythrin domain-containing protein [Fulvivirgaceae bacterium BMA10]|uniref:Hemerythrin domain-containing protein n=1 Tax=Splendidivirga corallicola TaxID=3051826 RepID=A0ABT8KM89_9BACT|nr:hemerythrin domain-containing protein [Fulvivirgaceae bacterium BMA10]